MKTFIVIDQGGIDRISWHQLINDKIRVIFVTDIYPKYVETFDLIITKDFSFDNLKFIFQQLISKHKFYLSHTFIVTNRDSQLLVCAELREMFGLAGNSIEQVSRFLNKKLMKSYMHGSSIPLPKFELYCNDHYRKNPENFLEGVISRIGLPIFIKPTNLYASLGTCLIGSKQELQEWCDNYVGGEFELDEFIEGELFHCDSIIKNNEILEAFVGKYRYPCHEFYHGKPAASIVIPFKSVDYREIAKFNNEALKVIGPVPDGVTHLEVFRKKDSSFIFLEVAARPAGAWICDMYRDYVGVDLRTAHYAMQMGTDSKITPVFSGKYRAGIWVPRPKGTINELHDLYRFKSEADISWQVEIGKNYDSAAYASDTLCRINLKNKDYSELERDFFSI